MRNRIILNLSLFLLLTTFLSCSKHNTDEKETTFYFSKNEEKFEYTIFCKNNEYGYAKMKGIDTNSKLMTTAGIMYAHKIHNYGEDLGSVK